MVPIPHGWNDMADFIITWLPIVLFGIIAFLMWKTTQYMPRVKPAAVDSEASELVAWSDIAGLDEAKEELLEVVDFLKDRRRFERLGARVPKGILLHGPPGTGKTLLAKAIASESGARFYASSASAFVEMFAGLGAARIRRLFAEARKNAPAIVFIDELDAAGSVRQGGGGYNREHDPTLNQLLAEFDGALERVVAGLQTRRVVTDKEKRILAYHEAGHALMSYLMGDLLPAQKVTIVSRGDALGYTFNVPAEDRYLHTREELQDLMKVLLAGRAAEQVVFGRVTNGASNDLERVTGIARAMVFEFGMSEVAPARTMRADNYALSEETKRMRDGEQARLTDDAYDEAQRLVRKHRAPLDSVAAALLEHETLDRDQLDEMLAELVPESRSSETVGTVRLVTDAAE